MRERDYRQSLSRWTRGLNEPVVFCENSNDDLTAIRALLHERMPSSHEILSFDQPANPRGKGYGEIQIMEYALNRSEILRQADYVVKITGRYYVPNWRKLLGPLQEIEGLSCVADVDWGAGMIHSGMVIFTSDFFYRYLLKYKDTIDDTKGYYLEHALMDAFTEASLDGRRCERFPEKPKIVGYSGTLNMKF